MPRAPTPTSAASVSVCISIASKPAVFAAAKRSANEPAGSIEISTARLGIAPAAAVAPCGAWADADVTVAAASGNAAADSRKRRREGDSGSIADRRVIRLCRPAPTCQYTKP